MSSSPRTRKLQACHQCDLLVDLADFVSHGRAECPRCGAVIAHLKHDSLNRTLAISVTALLLFLPATLLPLMSFDMLGQTSASSLLEGVRHLAADDDLWIAFMVAFCSLIVPLSILLLLFTSSLLSKIRALPELQILLLKSHYHLRHWGMLDVYMLSLLVAIVKMRDQGDLTMGIGLYAFIALLVLMILAQSQFDSGECWNRLEDPAP